jgi:hypothetical protein
MACLSAWEERVVGWLIRKRRPKVVEIRRMMGPKVVEIRRTCDGKYGYDSATTE